MDKIEKIYFKFLFSAMIIVAVMVGSSLYKEKQELTYTVEKSKTYTIYLDGEKVDNNNIDITLYDYSINDDTKTIYLAPKDRY